jgi:hypothetical protein
LPEDQSIDESTAAFVTKDMLIHDLKIRLGPALQILSLFKRLASKKQSNEPAEVTEYVMVPENLDKKGASQWSCLVPVEPFESGIAGVATSSNISRNYDPVSKKECHYMLMLIFCCPVHRFDRLVGWPRHRGATKTTDQFAARERNFESTDAFARSNHGQKFVFAVWKVSNLIFFIFSRKTNPNFGQQLIQNKNSRGNLDSRVQIFLCQYENYFRSFFMLQLER